MLKAIQIIISAAYKQKRHDRGKKILAEIWSDEKIFTVGAVTNMQNDGLCASNAGDLSEDSRAHLRSMKLAGVMLWATVTFDGSKSNLVYIVESAKVNTQVYVKILTEKVLPTESLGNCYIFTHDGVPSYTSNLTQQWCKDHFSELWDKIIWLP